MHPVRARMLAQACERAQLFVRVSRGGFVRELVCVVCRDAQLSPQSQRREGGVEEEEEEEIIQS